MGKKKKQQPSQGQGRGGQRGQKASKPTVDAAVCRDLPPSDSDDELGESVEQLVVDEEREGEGDRTKPQGDDSGRGAEAEIQDKVEEEEEEREEEVKEKKLSRKELKKLKKKVHCVSTQL